MHQFEVIALVLSGQLHNKGNSLIKPNLICHWKGRMGFVIDLEGMPTQISGMSYDCILMYWGHFESRFIDTFQSYGRITRPL